MLTANKGEWSELYAFLKIISERSIAAADSELHEIPDNYYTFIKLFRDDENGNENEYDISVDGAVNILDSSRNVLKTVSTADLDLKVRHIFERIKNADTTTFAIDGIEQIISDYLIHRIKAKSSEKTDIKSSVLDRLTGIGKELGFSIKSQIGSASTLLNASSHTNFIYTVNGYHGDIDAINSISGSSKIRDRLNAIIESDASIDFERTSSSVFNANLRLIDSAFGPILGQMLLDSYSGGIKTLPVLTDMVSTTNPYDLEKSEIEFKTKNFLRAIALGMVPGSKWDTYLKTYGGYIIVREDGNLVCYNLYNDDEFKDYLFKNTKFDSPSSTRHKYGELYLEGDQLKINLNLQIRFLK